MDWETARNVIGRMYLEINGRLMEFVTVRGYPQAPDGRLTECLVFPKSRRIEMSEFVPAQERESRVASAMGYDPDTVIWRLNGVPARKKAVQVS